VRWGKSRAEWKAGEWQPIEDEAKGGLAIELPAGERLVELVYRPPGMWAGIGVFAATLVVLVLGFVKRRVHVD
jgi:hypothetical protein